MSEWGDIEIAALTRAINACYKEGGADSLAKLLAGRFEVDTLFSVPTFGDNFTAALTRDLLMNNEPARAAETAVGLSPEKLLYLATTHIRGIGVANDTLREFLALTGITWDACPDEAHRAIQRAVFNGLIEDVKILTTALNPPFHRISILSFGSALFETRLERQKCLAYLRECKRQSTSAKNAADV